MKILVCGGRDYQDYDKVCEVLDNINPSIVIHGGANGADNLADWWATSRKKQSVVYKADWKENDKAAGVLRNQLMLDSEENIKMVIAFPGGRGTADMKRRARKACIPVWEMT